MITITTKALTENDSCRLYSRFLATCNRELREKVKILVDNGLLQFQM